MEWKSGVLGRLAALEGRWLVAVSGGGDSVALLNLLLEAGLGGRLVVGNFNHGWGDFGDASEVFVRGVAGRLGVAYVTAKGGGRAPNNAEAVARAERYGWMAQVCTEQGLAGVLVAHTRSDVAEGFLMRAGKGSGLVGLSSMGRDEVWQGELRVVRPLLGVGREELRDYLREAGQEWLEDPDNVAGGSQRARLRKLMPELAAAGVGEEGLAAAVASLRAAEEVVEMAVTAYLEQGTWKTEHGGRVILDKEALVAAPEEVGVRVLGRVLQDFGEDGEMLVRKSKRLALLERMRGMEVGVSTLGPCRFEWDAVGLRVERLTI